MLSVFQNIDPNRDLALAAQGNPAYTGVALHSSTQSIPIALHWGTRRIAPNLIWQGIDPWTINTVPVYVPSWDVVAAPQSPTNGNGYSPFVPPAAHSEYVQMNAGGFRGKVTIVNLFGQDTDFGVADSNSATSGWWVPAVLALCEGPVNSITRVWNSGGAAAMGVTWTAGTVQGVGGSSPLYSPFLSSPSLFYTLFAGDTAQTAWGFYAAADAFTGGPYYTTDIRLAYRQTAYIASPLVFYGTGNRPPQQSFEVVRTPAGFATVSDSYVLGTDVFFHDIIPDLLTNLQYGMGLFSGDIDATTLNTFKQYVMAQGLSVSPFLNSQTNCTDLLDTWAILSNTWIFWGGTSIIFVPLGDETITGNGQTFVPDQAAAYNLTNANFLPPGLQVTRVDPTDAFNRVRLEFSDRKSDYASYPIEWKDETLINLVGIRDASSIKADEICDVAVAAKVVELRGKRLAYIRNTYSFSLSYQFIRILPGTIVTLSDPNIGINGQMARVTSVSEDEKGVLSFTAEEYSGVLGISRARPSQAWIPSAGGAGGTSGGSTSTSGMGGSTSTSGGTLVQTASEIWVLFKAGDVITLPLSPTVGVIYTYVHDRIGSPQPSPTLLEENPVTFRIPVGATYFILDPQNTIISSATSTTGRVTGSVYRFSLDSNGLFRVL